LIIPRAEREGHHVRVGVAGRAQGGERGRRPELRGQPLGEDPLLLGLGLVAEPLADLVRENARAGALDGGALLLLDGGQQRPLRALVPREPLLDGAREQLVGLGDPARLGQQLRVEPSHRRGHPPRRPEGLEASQGVGGLALPVPLRRERGRHGLVVGVRAQGGLERGSIAALQRLPPRRVLVEEARAREHVGEGRRPGRHRGVVRAAGRGAPRLQVGRGDEGERG
jgi:hypothetical protein